MINRTAIRRQVHAEMERRGILGDAAKQLIGNAIEGQLNKVGLGKPLPLPQPHDIMENRLTGERRLFIRSAGRPVLWYTLPYKQERVDIRDGEWRKIGSF